MSEAPHTEPHEKPHKDQKDYVYLRAWKDPTGGFLQRKPAPDSVFGRLALRLVRWFYPDEYPDQRVISSVRVEADVETGDYLKRCAVEDLEATVWSAVMGDGTWANRTGMWWIVNPNQTRYRRRTQMTGFPTLKGAYWAHKLGVKR